MGFISVFLLVKVTMSGGDASAELSSLITIPFHTAKEAEIAWNTLRVDKEPPRGGCTKTMSVKGECLYVIVIQYQLTPSHGLFSRLCLFVVTQIAVTHSFS